MDKVFLVDDEPFVIEGLKTMIDWEKYGYRICGEAANGEDGLQLIRVCDPDLVVTDIRMPALDGLQLIRQIRESGNYKVKFIVLSGYNDFSYIQSAMKYRISDYLLKPIDDQEIAVALDRIRGQSMEQIGEETSRSDTPLNHDFFEIPLNALLEGIKNNDRLRLNENIGLLFQDFSRSGSPPQVIRTYLQNLLLEVIKYIVTLGGDLQEISFRFHTLSEMSRTGVREQWNARALDFLKSGFRELCEYAAEYISAIRDINSGNIISAVQNYIKENYAKDISLQKLAKHFYMNPVYLGQLFKKNTGRQFNEYLHQIRIDEAKKLLRRTNMKIAEIAHAIGYHDPDYFVSKFKAITQVPPSIFKKNGWIDE
jgi:YesN/AraC family two-component response regulator